MQDNMFYKFEIKEVKQEGAVRSFSGLASVYNIVDSDSDIVRAGAFSDSLMARDVKMLWQHKWDTPIGKFTKLEERGNALYVEGLISDTEKGREAYTLLKDGVISGLSVGFRTIESEYDNQKAIRTITKAELWEISIVTFPANEAANVTQVKSINEMLPKEVEKTLRATFNLSQKQAKAFMAKGYSAVRCEAEAENEEENQRDVEQLTKGLKELAQQLKTKKLIDALNSLTN